MLSTYLHNSHWGDGKTRGPGRKKNQSNKGKSSTTGSKCRRWMNWINGNAVTASTWYSIFFPYKYLTAYSMFIPSTIKIEYPSIDFVLFLLNSKYMWENDINSGLSMFDKASTGNVWILELVLFVDSVQMFELV